MDVINGNQQKFERYASMVDRVYENFNSEFADNKVVHGQIGSDEMG